MTKQAHITSRPEYEVGDRVLALCGRDFKVKVLWSDLPTDKPICRDCVDVALDAMTGVDQVITAARRTLRTATLALKRVDGALNPDDDLVLDVIAENEEEYTITRTLAREAEEAEERAKHTCTCKWERREHVTAAVRIGDPDCPIHGDEARPPIAPPDAPKTIDS